MADIKWIKITTDIFDDEKIKIIDSMPARDEILVVWFKLLALTGKVNQNGLLFLGNRIAYTPEMLAAIFNRELNTIRLALTTFENFAMIEISENEVISIVNWEKHQNIEGMDKIREQNRIRQQKYREKQKQLTDSNVTDNVTSQENNGTDKDKEEEKDKEKDNKFSELMMLYQQNIDQLPTNVVLKGLTSWYDHFGYELVKEAILITAKANVRKYNYMDKILKNWLNDGVKTIDDLSKEKLEEEESLIAGLDLTGLCDD